MEETGDEVLAECRKLLAHGLPATVVGAIDHDHPVIPLSIDIDQDAAAAAVIGLFPGGRHAGQAGLLTRTFQRRKGQWVPLGGGGGRIPDYPLIQRRAAADLHGYLHCLGGGQSVINPDRMLPWGARYVSYAKLRVSAEVERVQVVARLLDVPFHGYVVAVWATRRAPAVCALTGGNTPVAAIDLNQQVRRRPQSRARSHGRQSRQRLQRRD